MPRRKKEKVLGVAPEDQAIAQDPAPSLEEVPAGGGCLDLGTSAGGTCTLPAGTVLSGGTRCGRSVQVHYTKAGGKKTVTAPEHLAGQSFE